jgi:hypothetical protein
MKNNKINMLLALVFLAVLFWFIYQVILYIINIFVGLPKEIMAPIIAGISVVLASLITVIWENILKESI